MTDRELDEILIVHWPLVVRTAKVRGDEWQKRFVFSIAKNDKDPDWHPTRRQEHLMRRLVAELSGSQSDNPNIIEK